MKHTLEAIKKALGGCNCLTCENYDKVKDAVKGFEKELLDKLVNEKGIVTINDDDSTRDVLVGIKQVLSEKSAGV